MTYRIVYVEEGMRSLLASGRSYLEAMLLATQWEAENVVRGWTGIVVIEPEEKADEDLGLSQGFVET